MVKGFASLGLRIQNTREYFNSNLKNDEGFYTGGVVMIVMKVSSMTEKTRKSTFSEPHQTSKIMLDGNN